MRRSVENASSTCGDARAPNRRRRTPASACGIRPMRKALAVLVAGAAPLRPAPTGGEPLDAATRRRWTLSRATRRRLEETGGCWFDDDCGEEGTGGARRRRVIYDGKRQNEAHHCVAPNRGFRNSGRLRLVRGVTARDRVGGMGVFFDRSWARSRPTPTTTGAGRAATCTSRKRRRVLCKVRVRVFQTW